MRERYAELCIEVSLDHPVKSYVQIGAHKQEIWYEGVGKLGKKCGKIGHTILNYSFISHLHNYLTTQSQPLNKQNDWHTVSL